MKNEQQTLNRGVLQHAATAAASSACIVLMLAAVMTGCASFRLDPLITDAIDVEPMDSSRARVTTVQVRDHDGRLKVSARLKKRHRGRSPITALVLRGGIRIIRDARAERLRATV